MLKGALKGMPISISGFTEAELKCIARQWTKDLLARAAEVRKLQNVVIK